MGRTTMLVARRLNPVLATLIAAVGVAVVVTLLVSYQMLQTQQRIETVQAELERTKLRALELEEHAARLSFQREDAIKQLVDVQGRLDEATSEIGELRSKLDQSVSAIQDLQDQVTKTQSEIDDKQTRLDALQSEVEKLSHAIEQAHINSKKAIAERDALQQKLDQTNADIAKLKSKPNQANPDRR
jgi:chromosome segregation ATPase